MLDQELQPCQILQGGKLMVRRVREALPPPESL